MTTACAEDRDIMERRREAAAQLHAGEAEAANMFAEARAEIERLRWLVASAANDYREALDEEQARADRLRERREVAEMLESHVRARRLQRNIDEFERALA